MRRCRRYGGRFCRTDAEAAIAGYISQTVADVEAVALTRSRRKTAGKAVGDQAPLPPGFLLFRTKTNECLSRLTRSNNVLILLAYDNLSRELTGSGREIAEFLFGNGLLPPPRVTFVGGRLHFENGFLYERDE